MSLDGLTPSFLPAAPLAYFAVLILPISILVFTFLFTTLRFRLQRLDDGRFEGKEPPTLPYWIPFVGSAVEMSRNPNGFYKAAMFVCTRTHLLSTPPSP